MTGSAGLSATVIGLGLGFGLTGGWPGYSFFLTMFVGLGRILRYSVTEPQTLGIDCILFSTTIPGIPVSFSDKSVDVFGNSTPVGPGFILITGALDIEFLLLEIPGFFFD